jgi:hypothetical protein
MDALRLLPGALLSVIVAGLVANRLYRPLDGTHHPIWVTLIALAAGGVVFMLFGLGVKRLRRRR